MTSAYRSYVAVGDSFTEGVGDDTADGGVRGWADLVALGLALASPEPVGYANLAIRGRLLAPIVGAQLDAGIALKPQLLSLNGGGNDIMRPRVSIAAITDQLVDAAERAATSGAFFSRARSSSKASAFSSSTCSASAQSCRIRP